MSYPIGWHDPEKKYADSLRFLDTYPQLRHNCHIEKKKKLHSLSEPKYCFVLCYIVKAHFYGLRNCFMFLFLIQMKSKQLIITGSDDFE